MSVGPTRADLLCAGLAGRSAFCNSAKIAIPVREKLSLSAGIGYSSAEQLTNYSDWNAGATLQVYDWLALDARYFDSDNTLICGTLCDARFVAKISRSF